MAGRPRLRAVELAFGSPTTGELEDVEPRIPQPTTYAARARLASTGARASPPEELLPPPTPAPPARARRTAGGSAPRTARVAHAGGLVRFAAAATMIFGTLFVIVALATVWLRSDRAHPFTQPSAMRGGEAEASAARAAAASRRAQRISIAWVGDITLGSRYGLPPDGGRVMFAAVRGRLRKPDLTIGNLEGTFSVSGASKCGVASENCFAFQAPLENAGALRWAGFDVMNLANNHSWDFGADGQAQTVSALRSARVRSTGRPGEIRVVRRRGVRVALVGFAPYPWAASLKDIPRARTLIAAADRRADVVVALMHAGAEGADQTRTPWGKEVAFGEDRGDTRAFAHAAVDAGADLVLGSGPHVIRGVERYRGRLIAYSLGNFAGWDNFPRGGLLSLSGILRVTLRGDGVPTAGRWTPIQLVGPGIPQLDPAGTSSLVAAQLSRQDFGAAAGVGRSGRLRVRDRPARR